MGLVIILSRPQAMPLFVVHAPLAIPGSYVPDMSNDAAGSRREGAVMKGAALARKLLPRDSYNPWLAADMTKSPFGGPLALVVLPIFAKGAAEKTLDHLAAVIITEPEHFDVWSASLASGWGACSWKALASSALAEPCAAALMSVEVLLRRSRPDPEPTSIGYQAHTQGPGVDRWRMLHRLHTRIQCNVRSALTAAGGKVAEYADRVNCSSFSDAPASLQVHDNDAIDEAWARERFSTVLLPPPTQALPPIVAQPQTSFRPSSVRDLLLPAAHTRLIHWLRANARDIQDMLTNGAASKRPHKPKPLVLGQSEFVPEARGLVWDLRGAARGVIVPLDFAAAPVHDLNIGRLQHLLGDCPDKELIDHLVRGVDFKAELPLQAVFLPHMTSLAPHVALVEREIERLVDCKWHEILPSVPFLPMRLNPNGAVVRKLEQLRPRRVENASADGHRGGRPLVDADGVPVRSLNEAVGIQAEAPDGDDHTLGLAAEPCEALVERKWPKETKPAVLDKVHDLAVLRFAARIFDEDLVGFVVDFKDYFNNFPVNARYLWVNICHWRSLLGIGGEDLGSFVSELRLGFGVSAASNVCQRFAHALAEIFRAAFDQEEEAILQSETDEKRREYLQQRRRLGPKQCRLYEISIYTDDPFFACVGIDRLVRALRLWHRIMDDIKLELAVVAKRQCGAELSWLGVQFLLTAGAHFITPNKRMRALREVSRIVAAEETVTFAEYRTITSFLQYLKPLVLHLKGDAMYHLYGPYRRRADGSLPGAGDMVVPNKAALGCLERWVDILSGACAAFFSATLNRRPLEQRPEYIHLYSDAALEETESGSMKEDESGLGGFCEGLFWHLPLAGCARRLPITVLEFVAIGVNIIVFARLLRKARSVLCSDSLSSVHVFNNFSARGELMQYTHRAVLALTEYQELCNDSPVVHCYGPANPCADAASRHQIERLQRVCAHLGIVPERLEVPPRAHALLLQVCSFAEKHNLLTDGPRRRKHNTSVDLKQAAQSNNGFGHRGHGEDAPVMPKARRARPSALALRPVDAQNTMPPSNGHKSQPTLVAARARTSQRPDNSSRAPVASETESPSVETTGPSRNRRARLTVAAPPYSGTNQDLRTLLFPGGAKAPASRRARGAGSAAPQTAFDGRAVGAISATTITDSGNSISAFTPGGKRLAQQDIGAGESAHTRRCIRPEVASHPNQVSTARSRGQQRLACASRARAAELATKLASDTSPLALRPPDPKRLEALCEAHIIAAQTVHAPGTLDVDGTAWRRWEAYCHDMGTPPVRSADGTAAFSDPSALDRETILQSGFLIHLATVVEPRSKMSPAVKPQSLFNNLLAVRRVHQRLNIDFRVCKGAGLTLKAQIRRFVRENGPEALMPARKEPLDANDLRRVLSLDQGIPIGRRRLDWDDYFFISFKAMLCTGLAAAFRKAELCLPDGTPFALGQLSIASVSWVIGGTSFPSSARDKLANLALGDFCVVKPPICKNDPFALHFGTKPIWLPVNEDPVNAARAMAAMFLADASPALCPEQIPLFRASRAGEAIRHGEADAVFRDLVAAAFPAADPSRWSLHSLRIGAACALLAARASHALIQAVCRWRSTKSVDIYARLGPTDYARFVRTIEQQTVDAITTQRVHEIRLDYDDIVAAQDGPRQDLDDPAD